MKRLFIISVFCLAISYSLGQSVEKKSFFTFDVTKFVLPTLNNTGSIDGTPITGITTKYVHYPRLTFGYKRRVKEMFDIGIDIGYGNNKLSIYQLSNDFQLLELRPEFDYLLGEKKNNYIGLEFFYIHNQDIFNNSVFNGEINNVYGSYRFDESHFTRSKIGLMLKYGINFKIFKSFGINIYTGLGGQKSTNTYFNAKNPTVILDFFGKHGHKNYLDEKSFVYAEFTMGAKLYFLSK